MKVFGLNDTVEQPVLITYASLIHFLSALYFACVIYPLFDKKNSFVKGFILYNILHLLYELKDYILSYNKNVSDYLERRIDKSVIKWSKENSIENSVGDTIVTIIGYIIGYYLLLKFGNNINITTGLTFLLILAVVIFFVRLKLD
tara:strand:- start:704 stop:1138 length:435 start_codon:yes stop_codon:yes gene_type:complete